MKTPMLSTVFVAAALFCGCSSPKFTEFHDAEVIQGKGGEVRSVDGIDIWEKGQPSRKFRILGSVDETPHNLKLGRLSRLFPKDRDAAIAKIAHEHGGDAIIIVVNPREPSDEMQLGDGSRRWTALVVVKYVQ